MLKGGVKYSLATWEIITTEPLIIKKQRRD